VQLVSVKRFDQAANLSVAVTLTLPTLDRLAELEPVAFELGDLAIERIESLGSYSPNFDTRSFSLTGFVNDSGDLIQQKPDRLRFRNELEALEN